ncbi:hypothetical protein DL770_007138 [Monosporascus sp. CRB-9-2]|nr:hypothetical protein DL770_007138 [Monosporascus sp. CRB-9-2]
MPSLPRAPDFPCTVALFPRHSSASDSREVNMAPPRLALLSAAALALLDISSAEGSQNGNSSGVFDATAFFKNPSEVLAIPLRRVDHQGVGTPSLAKRFFKTDVLEVYGAAYLVNLTIGNSDPPQAVNVLLDTGSFELWVNPDCGRAAEPGFCEEFGRYDPALSTTREDLGQPFEIQYGSGATSGTYYRDDIYINDARIQGQQFGVSDMSEVVWFGIMGLAHGLGGSGTDTNGFLDYPGIVDSLAAQRFTQSKLFSLDLGGQIRAPGVATTGQIVFGGVDRSKYAGNLRKVPTMSSDPHYRVQLTGLSHAGPGAAAARPLAGVSLPVSVIVDSGTTLSHLPESVVAALAAGFPGAVPDGQGGYEVPCDYMRRNGSVAFEFGAGGGGTGGGVRIDVRYADFVWNNGAACYLGAWYSPDVGIWILGDTFLRGAYVAFDQDNEALYMANYVSCGAGSDLVPVPAGPDAASNIVGACQAAAPLPIASSLRPSSRFSTRATSTSPTISPFPPTTSPITLSTTSPTSVARSSTPPSASSGLSSTTPSGSPSGARVSSSSSPAASAGSTSPGAVSPINSNPSVRPSASSTSRPLNPAVPAAGSPAPTTAANSSAGAGDDDGLPGFGGLEATATTTTTTAQVTYTSTVTRAEVYTVTACPPSVRDCPLGRLATRFRAFVTTICTDAPDAPISTTGPPPVVAAPIVGVGPGPDDGPETEVEEVTEVQVQVVTSHCSTRTYAVTACAPGDAGCAVGTTTTSVTTVFRTTQLAQTVAASASASASAPPIAQVVGKVSAPTPVPVQTTPTFPGPGDADVGGGGAVPTVTKSVVLPGAAGGYYGWSASNGSVDGAVAQPDCVACSGVNVVPSGVAVVAGAEGRAVDRGTLAVYGVVLGLGILLRLL